MSLVVTAEAIEVPSNAPECPEWQQSIGSVDARMTIRVEIQRTEVSVCETSLSECYALTSVDSGSVSVTQVAATLQRHWCSETAP